MSTPVRYSIKGHRIEGSIFKTKCYGCGMPTLAADEFHPHEACQAYNETHNSVYVERLIEPLYRQRVLRDPALASDEAKRPT